MDDWNDFRLETSPPASVSQERLDNDVDLGSGGDLDSATSCEDIGISARTFGTSDRFHLASFTKLEVITSMQIHDLLLAFHILIAVAFSFTLASVIVVNTLFSSILVAPINSALINQNQRDWAEQNYPAATSNILNSVGTPMVSRIGRNEDYTPYSTPQVYPARLRWFTTRELTICEFNRMGTGIVGNDLVSIKVPDLRNRANPCFAYWDSHLTLAEVLNAPKGYVVLPNIARQGFDENYGFELGNYNWPLRVERPPKWYTSLYCILDICLGLLLIFVSALFLVRLASTGHANLMLEQMLAAGMLFAMIPFFNIPHAILAFEPNNLVSRSTFPYWFRNLEKPFSLISYSSVPSLVYFLVWSNLHAYRVLDIPSSQRFGRAFFAPKAAVAIIYAAAKITLFLLLQVETAEVPLISFVAMMHTFHGFNLFQAYPSSTMAILLFSVFEFALLLILVWEAIRTSRALHQAPYLRYRAKQIGFRFFTYLHFVFFVTYFFLDVLLIVTTPRGNALIQLNDIINFAYVVRNRHTIGTRILLFGYVTIWAYVNLPHTSVGTIKGWFKSTELFPSSSWHRLTSDSSDTSADIPRTSDSSKEHYTPQFLVDRDEELNQEIIAPVVYRKMESTQDLELKANCFTMQTHVILFNFSWYVYYYGTPKFDKFAPSVEKVPLPFRFTVTKAVHDEATDTLGLVIDGSDRIVVTFKGTTSMRNMRTSLAAYHERLVHVVPTGDRDLKRLEKIFGLYYETAKIHKGFALAYTSVAKRITDAIIELHNHRPRPVFLTGHSLGGALATICSLDVWIKLRISRRQIFVSTFGAPRVGNDAFRRIYNSVIVMHWRVVVDPDLIARLPKGKYRHVGKEAMLTQQGDLCIDPNPFDRELWSVSSAGLAFHRKASYLLAIQTWCTRRHKKSYTPSFWEFNVSAKDKMRFASLGARKKDSTKSKLAKMIKLVDAIPLRNLKDSLPVNTQVITRWARLASRLLEEDSPDFEFLEPTAEASETPVMVPRNDTVSVS